LSRNRILVVDDEASVRFGVRSFLESHGYEVAEAGLCSEAERSFRDSPPDAAVLDYLLPDGNALDLLGRLKALDADVPLIILTAHGSIELAVRAIKEGAEHFLTKPVELPALRVVLERLLENRKLRRRSLARTSRATREPPNPFLGASPAILRLEEEARRVLTSESPVLILGETGSGKGVLASWIHSSGPRADEAFVDLNCAGLGREFLETELFGHEKGAFTGAVAAKPGLLEVAHRGTVFLDEIGDMDLAVQAKLLKVLEEKRFRRLGDVRDRTVDVHLITATHHDLESLVGRGSFRQDLYYRISTLPLHVPPLRDRPEDIPLIAQRLLDGLGGELGRPGLRLSPAAEAALRDHPWPGNVRELRNVLERAILRTDGEILGSESLVFSATPAAAGTPDIEVHLTLREVERRHIMKALHEEGGHVERAARRLGVPRSSLYDKIKRLEIVLPKPAPE
jgi:DNA-binding NtrC family response regulator